MNGILLVILAHHLLLQNLRGKQSWWREIEAHLRAVQSCVEARDYGLRELPAKPRLAECDACLRELLETGRYDPERIEPLFVLIGEWRELGAEILRLKSMLLIRALMAWVLALVVRCLLVGEGWLVFDTMVAVSIGLYGILLYGMLRAMPRSETLRDPLPFVQAWLGAQSSGPWQGDLEQLKQQEWLLGRNQDSVRDRLLQSVWHQERDACRRRLDLVETGSGLWDLLLALLLGCLLWSEPLLDRIVTLL